ncbi:noncanonical pyrimidine nucleotidase, YjjG family [Sporolactobacillus sp. THM7-4]|nr:noncanonical pyrimidine nucleotidase, YjjG family [Sporolactobacillus sp. THM7-4]
MGLISKYDYILFDADNTLFDYDKAEAAALEKTMKRFGYFCDDTTRATYRIVNQNLWNQFEAKDISIKDLQVERFSRLFTELGIEGDAAAFNLTYLKTLADSAHLIDGAEELCGVLSKYSRLVIVTNGISMTQHRRFDRSAIKDDFEALFVSEDIGFRKPQVEFFKYVFSALQIRNKNKVLIVGDSLTADIQGGENAGIATCWYNPGKKENHTGIDVDFEIGHLAELKEIVLAEELN